MSYVEIFEGIANRVRAGENAHEVLRAFSLVSAVPLGPMIATMAERAAVESRRVEAEALPQPPAG